MYVLFNVILPVFLVIGTGYLSIWRQGDIWRQTLICCRNALLIEATRQTHPL